METLQQHQSWRPRPGRHRIKFSNFFSESAGIRRQPARHAMLTQPAHRLFPSGDTTAIQRLALGSHTFLGDLVTWIFRCKPQGQLILLVGSRCPGFDQTPDLSSLSGSVNGCFWNLFISLLYLIIYIYIYYTFNITKVEKTFGDDGWLSHCLGDKLFWLHGRFCRKLLHCCPPSRWH
jgi:hypothetical protein